MKIYVAFRTDEAPEGAPTKMANPSLTKLKLMMKGEMDPVSGEKLKKPIDMVGAEFTAVLYDFKPNVANVCQAIVDVTELDAESATDYRINDHGQLREVK
jgi:hypothetical protein